MSLLADAAGLPADANHRSARETEEKLLQEHPDSSDYYYEAALVYLRFPAKVVPNRPGKSPVDPKTFAEECISHALSMLEAAEKAGYFRLPEGIKLLKSDTHLDPIRSRASFQRLVGRVAAREAALRSPHAVAENRHGLGRVAGNAVALAKADH